MTRSSLAGIATGYSAATPPDDLQDPAEADGPGEAIVEDGEVVDGETVDDRGPADRRVFATSHFSGPLPPPETMTAYNEAVPGLAREIVDQWKAETAHRHRTIDELRETDREAMRLFHEGEKRGQRYAVAAIALLLCVVLVSLILDRPVVGVAAVVAGAATVVWALRRRSDIPDSPQIPPTDVGDGDQLEGTMASRD